MTNTELMHKYPPTTASQVTLANWRKPPFNKWAFQHVREIVPSADIPHDPDLTRHLPSSPVNFDDLAIESNGSTLSFAEFLKATDTDGLVVLHRGNIVCETYATGMTAQTPHILMSVSKSVLGMLAGILVDRGDLVLDEPVTRLIPEIANTAYSGATLRNMLDMRVGILFDENYLATSGPIIAYRKAQNWDPLELGEEPSDLRSFFPSLIDSDGTHGGNFHYVSPNTDLFGWVIERATGKRYADLVSELLWKPMGASHSAYITVDRLGAPRCAGGFCATARDLARFGQLILENGRRDGNQIIPSSWIKDITENGDVQAWNAGDFAKYLPNLPIHYRNKWYVQTGKKPMLFGVGVHGQNVFVDRGNKIVIAKFSSQATAMDEERISLTMHAIAAIREYLGGLTGA